MLGGRQVHTLIGHTKWVWSVAFSPNGNHVVSGSHDTVVKIWDTKTGVEVRSFVGVRCRRRGGQVSVRMFPTGFDPSEGVPGE